MTTLRAHAPVRVQLLLGAAFAALSALVVVGACTRIDQYGIDHWMARVGTGPGHTSLVDAFRPDPSGGSASEILFNIWTFPASVPVSAAVLALCCVMLERRGERRAAVAWVVAWVVVNAIEVAGKDLLHRPALSTVVNGVRLQVTAYDSSFPSGHTSRALLLAFMLAAVWPRLAWPAGLWAAGACILLVVSGDHTPSDIVGGALAALLVLMWVRPGWRHARWRNETRALENHVRGRTPRHVSLED